MRLKAFTQFKIKQMTNVRVVLYIVTFDWMPNLTLPWTHRIPLSATIEALRKGFCNFLQLLQANDK